MSKIAEWLRHRYIRIKLYLFHGSIKAAVAYTDPTKPNQTGVCLVRAGSVFGEEPVNSTPVAPIPVPERLKDHKNNRILCRLPLFGDVAVLEEVEEYMGDDRRVHYKDPEAYQKILDAMHPSVRRFEEAGNEGEERV
jgi:hypothetical protein